VKTIAGEAGQHMHMHMRNLLTGGLAISQEEVDPLTSHTTAAQSLGHPRGSHEDMGTRRIVQVRE